MKTNNDIKLIVLAILFYSISQNAMSQYYNYLDPYSFGLQLQLQQQQQQILKSYSQQMNDYYYKITPNFRYITTDGKSLTIEIQLSRTTAFSNVECHIKNQSGTTARNIEYRTVAGDVIVPVGGSNWTIQQGDVLIVYFDKDKSWSYTFGKDFSPQDWSRYCQNQLVKAIENFKEKNNVHQYQSSPTFTSPLSPNQNNNSVNQASNRQRASTIDAQITQLQSKLADAQKSLSLYQGWENERPGISTSQLVQSARNLINTYTQQIYNLQIEKANWGNW